SSARRADGDSRGRAALPRVRLPRARADRRRSRRRAGAARAHDQAAARLTFPARLCGRVALAHALARAGERAPLALVERVRVAPLELPDELLVAQRALLGVAREPVQLAERGDRARVAGLEQQRAQER